MIIVTDKILEKEIKETILKSQGRKEATPSPRIIFYTAGNETPQENAPYQQSHLSQQLSAVINGCNSENVIFASSNITYNVITDVMLNYAEKPYKFSVLKSLYEKIVGKVMVSSKIGGLCVVNLLKENLPVTSRWVKRFMDVFFSCILIILFLPVLIIVPVLIKLTSKGPVIFMQVRAGLNGKPFKLYKFRTMVLDADKLLGNYVDINKLKEPVFKFKNDKRVTPLGRILRRTSIDELPQIFNVLKGDISLVGPRPEDVKIVKRYNALFKERLLIKPGVTGLQQINCRGNTSMADRIKYDKQYMENQSLLFNLKILAKTVKVVLSCEGAW